MGRLDCFFTKKDIQRLFNRKKSFYKKVFCVVFLSVLCFRFMDPPSYEASAIFKQAVSEQNQSDMLRSFLQNSKLPSSKDSGPQAVFESRMLLKKVVGELGLVLHVQDRSFITRILSNAKDHVRSELGLLLQDRQTMQFSKAMFEGANPSSFFIKFQEDHSFEVLDLKKNLLATGKLGVPVEVPEGTFTLNLVKDIRIGHLYKITVQSWFDAVKNVRAHLKIKSSKLEKNIFSLSFSHPQAKVAASLLNHLMSSYQSYLKKENEELATIQMQYLEKRQQELLNKYDLSLEEHTAFLTQSLEDTGFVNLKQEVDLLEKPSEEHLKRLYDIDLRLMRLQRDIQLAEHKKPSSQHEAMTLKSQTVAWETNAMPSQDHWQDLDGMTPETAQKQLTDYAQQWDLFQDSIEQLTYLQGQIFRSDFEITSLSGVLTDSVSQEMIQKAAKAALEQQDTVNYSAKDQERIQGVLTVQKRFLSQHIAQLLSMYRLKSRLLEERMASLQKGSVHLLEAEKALIQNQLDSFQDRMRSLPEKWKRENQLVMQRELSIGMVEGLTQLAESKNIHHHLFHVESKPIDHAHAPYKSSRKLIWGQGLLAGALLCGFAFARDLLRWIGRGRAITQDSAKELGAIFCGVLNKNCKDNVHQMKRQDKETLRKVSAFISAHSPSKGAGLCASIFSESQSFCLSLASLLADKELKVLLIECSPSLMDTKEGGGLYDYLLDKTPVLVSAEQGFSRIFAGGYEGRFVELLARKKFTQLIEENLSQYDVVLLSLQAESSDAATAPLQSISSVFVLHSQDVFYEEVSLEKPTAVVLFD